LLLLRITGRKFRIAERKLKITGKSAGGRKKAAALSNN